MTLSVSWFSVFITTDVLFNDLQQYTLKHIVGLINQSPSLTKKTRQRLLQYVEDPDGLKNRK